MNLCNATAPAFKICIFDKTLAHIQFRFLFESVGRCFVYLTCFDRELSTQKYNDYSNNIVFIRRVNIFVCLQRFWRMVAESKCIAFFVLGVGTYIFCILRTDQVNTQECIKCMIFNILKNFALWMILCW